MTSSHSNRNLRLVLANARVYRTPADEAPAEAIGIGDGMVAAIGSSDDLAGLVSADTKVVDLGGRAVLPSFIDSHTHFHRGSILQELYLDFEALAPATVTEVLAAVRERAATLPAGAWVQADGLSTLRLHEGRLPDRRELDGAAPDHPVVLRGIGKHVVAANSLALSLAGIAHDTPDPAGGRIERDESGAPNGILHERAKLRLDQSHPETVVPSPDHAARMSALRAGIRRLHRAGVTTIHEMIRLPQEAADLSELHAEGDLGVRVRMYYRVHESPLSLDWLEQLGIRRGLGDDWLRILGVKLSVDGFCIFRNAAVHEPYPGDEANCGIFRIEPDELARLVDRANRQRLQVCIHAVGVRAVDAALDAFESAGEAVAGPYRLEHGYIDMDEARLRRALALRVAWSTQPAFIGAYEREWLTIFGRQRADAIMPIRVGHELGIPTLFNSDFPCAPFDPLGGIRAAVTRRGNGEPLGAGQEIGVTEAWSSFTTVPAAVAGDARLGRLEPGAHADLVVLSDDPLADPDTLPVVHVSATMVAGTFVHGEAEVGV